MICDSLGSIIALVESYKQMSNVLECMSSFSRKNAFINYSCNGVTLQPVLQFNLHYIIYIPVYNINRLYYTFIFIFK